MRDLGGLNETDLCQGAGGVDGPPLGVDGVGVVLGGEFAVGLLDIGQGGVWCQAEDAVVVRDAGGHVAPFPLRSRAAWLARSSARRTAASPCLREPRPDPRYGRRAVI